jgi:hypothetical protein
MNAACFALVAALFVASNDFVVKGLGAAAGEECNELLSAAICAASFFASASFFSSACAQRPTLARAVDCA